MGFTFSNRSRGESFDIWAHVHPKGLVVNVMTHDGGPTDAFDERRVGLDHLSFAVADRAELERWTTHLDAHKVPHSGVIDAHFGATVVFRDPDNMQLELFVQPKRAEVANLIATDPTRPTA